MMVKAKLITILGLFILVSCRHVNTLVVKNYWHNDSSKLKEQFEVLQSKPSTKDGLYQSFYENGNKEFIKHYSNNLLTDSMLHYNSDNTLIEKAFYKNNLLEGTRILYFNNNKNQLIEHYKNNLLEGEALQYYENGNLLEKGKFIHDKREGSWIFYYENGKTKEIVEFKNGSENGNYQGFYNSGTKKSTGFYKDELEDSTWYNYYESGKLMEIVNYKFGKEEGITKVFSKDSVLVKEITYHLGFPIEYHDYITGKQSKHMYDFLDKKPTKISTNE
ncbi:MAG: hypothetical protein RJA07_1879 [Bacteroidota bacterium]|jgi:antitoxin component YwqK of YwqJK toxin-antitoxin module